MDDGRAREIADTYSLGAVVDAPTYVARGAMGEIWRVSTARGAWAVKVLFEWDPPPSVPADIPVQEAAARAGVRLPRPVLTSSGDAVCAVGPLRVRVYEWFDLAPAVDVPVGAERAGEVGRILGTIHALELPVSGPVDPWYTSAPSPSAWTTLVTQATEADAPWMRSLAAQAPLLCELGEFVANAKSGAAIVCHRDFGPDNVLPLLVGSELSVLDWENAGPLHPEGELASALLSWTAGGGHLSSEAAVALLSGYSEARGIEPALTRASFNVAAATQLNFLKVMADQALVESRHRGFAVEMVEGLLGGSFVRLRAYIDELVTVLGLPAL